jgi:glycosyltransferase involved in cell wall biosynthesis
MATQTGTSPQILMVGTDMASKGGVSSVIRLYEEAGLFNTVKFMASFQDGPAWRKGLFFLGFLLRYLGALLTQPQLKLVHVHTSSNGSFARKSLVILLACLFGKKVVIHMHGAGFAVFYDRLPPLLQWYTRWVLCRSDVLIALSSQWKIDLARICQHPDIRVLYNPTVLKNPVFEDTSLERPADSETRKNGMVNFLFMGRLGKRKGVYDIIESARHVQADNVKIHLYGDGEIDEVKRQVLAAGVSDKIAVHGWIDGNRKDATFREANVLLLPSYHEGLPISVLEALAYGLPVLATDVGGIAEAVENGVNGFLINPGACETLANRIEQLAASPELRLEMGKSGYRMAADKFDLSVIMRQLEALYAEIIG